MLMWIQRLCQQEILGVDGVKGLNAKVLWILPWLVKMLLSMEHGKVVVSWGFRLHEAAWASEKATLRARARRTCCSSSC